MLATSPITGYTLSNFLTGEVMAFDAQGRYMSDTDAYGNQNSLTAGTNQPTSETNSGGRALAFSYNNGLLADAQSPLWQSGGANAAGSQHVAYGYNARGQLTSLVRGAGTGDALTETFGYSGTQLVTVTTGADHQWTLGYDPLGRLASITSPMSGTAGQAGYTPSYTTAFSYTAGQTVVMEGYGTTAALTHTYTLDAQGQATAIQDGLGDTTHATYDQDHDVLTSVDANGHMTTNLYQYVGPTGSTGLVTQTVRPALTSYVAPGNASDPVTTRYRYDPTRYDLLETDKPAGGIVLYGYDGAHSVMTTTELLKVTTSGLPGCPSSGATALRTAALTTASMSCPLTYHWRASVDRYNGYGERVAATDGRGVAVPDTTDTGGITPTATFTDTQGLDTRQYAYDAQGDQVRTSTPPITTTLNGYTATAPAVTLDAYDGDGNRTAATSANSSSWQ